MLRLFTFMVGTNHKNILQQQFPDLRYSSAVNFSVLFTVLSAISEGVWMWHKSLDWMRENSCGHSCGSKDVHVHLWLCIVSPELNTGGHSSCSTKHWMCWSDWDRTLQCYSCVLSTSMLLLWCCCSGPHWRWRYPQAKAGVCCSTAPLFLMQVRGQDTLSENANKC